MASTYLSRTQSTSPTSAKIGTISFWVKRGTLADQHILNGYTDANNRAFLNFTSDDRLQVGQKNSGTTVYQIEETPQRRDVSAWYHCVFAFDTTDGTASNRFKLYVNGSQVTDFTTNNEIEVNEDIKFFNLANLQLGRAGGDSNYFDGSLAHFHYADGTAYDASTFGETDATTGIWKPKTAPSVTYGINGFFLKFENSAAFGTDSSGNANNFTVNGTMTQNIDTPSNVFATGNALNYSPSTNFSSTTELRYGNLRFKQIAGVDSDRRWVSTFGVTEGKYYFEAKCTTGITNARVGISDQTQYKFDEYVGKLSSDVGYVLSNGSVRSNNTEIDSGEDIFTTSDIICVALDATNSKVYFRKNDGSWVNSADPVSGTNGYSLTSGATYFPSGSLVLNNSVMEMNFGNGYFGTTAVSSAQNPDDGIGIFEYAVPTGYKALCTKSINAQEYD